MRFLSIYYDRLGSGQYKDLQVAIEKSLAGEIHSKFSNNSAIDQTQVIPYKLNIKHIVEQSRVDIVPDLLEFQLLQHGEGLSEKIATAIAHFIVDHCEAGLITQLLSRRCYKKNIDSSKVERYCNNLLNNNPWDPNGRKFSEQDRLRRKQKIIEELIPLLETNTEFHLDGYMMFRMTAYKRELIEVIEYAIDEYILDKQYEEFMTLLKYFVGLQETKMNLVHLIQQDGNSFVIYDEQLKPLELKHEHDKIIAETLEAELNIEDIVISSLISASPEEIVVHAKQPDFQVVRSVKAIFGDRATICENCPLCHHNHEETIYFP